MFSDQMVGAYCLNVYICLSRFSVLLPTNFDLAYSFWSIYSTLFVFVMLIFGLSILDDSQR